MFCTVHPFTGAQILRRNLNSLFNNENEYAARYDYPLVNAYDSTDFITVVAQVPGVAKEDLSVSYENGVLKISGRRKLHDVNDKAEVLRKERALGNFEKSLQIPVKIDDSKITASLKNGIVTIVLPKSDDVKPKTININ